jgi:hypothetical protein
VNGTPTTLISENVTAWANGDEMDCEVQGSTIILSRVTGGVTTELLRFNDATFTSGKTGLMATAIVLGDGVIDNFSMGGFAAAAVPDQCGCDNH